jgi:hypothetical protein
MTQKTKLKVVEEPEKFQEFVRDSLDMERWWLRYYSLLHVVVGAAALTWISAMFPEAVPQGLRIVAWVTFPMVLAALFVAGFQHGRLEARLAVQELQAKTYDGP